MAKRRKQKRPGMVDAGYPDPLLKSGDGDDEAGEPQSSDEDILKEACERWDYSVENDTENRKQYKDDYNFTYTPGSQWDDSLRAQRNVWKEPCLEFNQLTQFVHQVVNDQRQNRPGIRIHPAGGKASEEAADIRQGMVRSIEYHSKAESVYDTGYECSVVGGRGWWRMLTEFEPMSFNQRIVIKAIKDALSVRADDNYEEPDARDRKWLFVQEALTKDEFTRRYPKAKPLDWDSIDKTWTDGRDTVIVVDYYRRIARTRTLVMMSDGAVGWLDTMPPPPPNVKEVARREAEDWEVEWFKLAGGQQVLERYECPGKYIPVIQTVGDELLLEGKRTFQGLIRHAKDPQRMLNYGMTQQAIHLALTPRAPWVAAAGQIEAYKDIWKNANVDNYAYLPYDPQEINGVIVPPPQRTQPSMPDAGWLNWTQQQIAMIKSTIGMYENSLGQRNNEQSGRAILAREKQGDNATFHFSDNLSRAIALTGEIAMDWLPVVYDTRRIVHIVGLDGSRKQVELNQPGVDVAENGAIKSIKLNSLNDDGQYAVVVEAGPSYATKRQETADKLAQLVKAFPPIMQVAGDLVVKAQDIPDADALAERLRFALPPAIQEALRAEEQGNKPPDPKSMMLANQLKQMQGMLQKAGQEVQRLQSGIAEKMQAAQMSAQATKEAADRASQEAMVKAQNDTVKAIRQAEFDSSLKIRLAMIDQQTALRKAAIDRATKLEVAVMATEAEQEQQRMVLEAEAYARAAQQQVDDEHHYSTLAAEQEATTVEQEMAQRQHEDQMEQQRAAMEQQAAAAAAQTGATE